MDTRELLGSHCTDDVIAFFAKKFTVSAANLERVFEEIEEWWFVPRSADAIKASKERVNHSCALYRNTHHLPDAYLDAYRFVRSERNIALEERLNEGRQASAAA